MTDPLRDLALQRSPLKAYGEDNVSPAVLEADHTDA